MFATTIKEKCQNQDSLQYSIQDWTHKNIQNHSTKLKRIKTKINRGAKCKGPDTTLMSNMFGRRKLRPIDPPLQMHRQHAIHPRAMPQRMDKAQTKFPKGTSPLLSLRVGFRVQALQAHVSELGYAQGQLLASQIELHMLYHSDGSIIARLDNFIEPDLHWNEQR